VCCVACDACVEGEYNLSCYAYSEGEMCYFFFCTICMYVFRGSKNTFSLCRDDDVTYAIPPVVCVVCLFVCMQSLRGSKYLVCLCML
jgi:hypothetical protein